MPSNAGRDEISDEARMLAERVRDRAASLPDAAVIAGMAMTTGGEMSPAEIRQLAIDAIEQAQRVSFLLGRLASLLDEPPGDPGAR